jgi:uncharacterized damage-inducible protein DinB
MPDEESFIGRRIENRKKQKPKFHFYPSTPNQSSTTYKGEIIMTEKEAFIGTFKREYETTARVLAAYPDAKLDLKPGEKSKTAGELAWSIANSPHFLDMVISGNVQPGGAMSPAPKTMAEIISALKESCAAAVKAIEGLPEAELGKTIKFFTGPGKMGDLPRNGVMWTVLYDHIHHRGQFSVYLRAAGAKVPSIYGPTADEPWM